ncbi:MAG: SDR family NAD(P)-dependent oxidoreductase [Polyangiales bacterium]|nr:SDR family NAD(P)-dependent oxidoreductase [Myxococcales bacterium]MCB9661975.1 SDR family NAD(P)-dependent oxidoreductase [Sandaracinaceae bacterium]
MLARIRRRLLRPAAAPNVDLRGQRAVVTGVSAGSLGAETAATLAAWGATVVVTRRAGAAAAARELEQRSGATVHGYDLDLANARSVREFARWYEGALGNELDVLVNNAGIHLDLLSEWEAPRLSPDGFETQWRTNYLGSFQLTLALLPALLAAGARTGDARVVNVASHLHHKGRNADLFAAREPYDSWAAYGASKLAMIHAAFELERRHGAQGVHGYALHPGAVFTNVASVGLAGHGGLARVRTMLAPVERFFLLTPEEGAQTSVFCATAPDLAGGRYFTACAECDASADTRDAAAAARLWDASAAWVRSLRP